METHNAKDHMKFMNW